MEIYSNAFSVVLSFKIPDVFKILLECLKVMYDEQTTSKNVLSSLYAVKENQIGSVVSEILATDIQITDALTSCYF